MSLHIKATVRTTRNPKSLDKWKEQVAVCYCLTMMKGKDAKKKFRQQIQAKRALPRVYCMYYFAVKPWA